MNGTKAVGVPGNVRPVVRQIMEAQRLGTGKGAILAAMRYLAACMASPIAPEARTRRTTRQVVRACRGRGL